MTNEGSIAFIRWSFGLKSQCIALVSGLAYVESSFALYKVGSNRCSLGGQLDVIAQSLNLSYRYVRLG